MCMAAIIETYCPDCADLKAFEQPPCVDGHGADCPEWLCLSCGTALLIGVPVEPSMRSAFGSRAA
ncbi:MAG: hypothetical protein DLM62_11295 [Pseudonocardiales bacterium]|nr:MAG: hypothetical protein DLM62_11295 [Pseudonocardiales bacterium]